MVIEKTGLHWDPRKTQKVHSDLSRQGRLVLFQFYYTLSQEKFATDYNHPLKASKYLTTVILPLFL